MTPAQQPSKAPSQARSGFVERLGFEMDPFQSEACAALDAGRSVLVSAPTGAGKTVVADYAVALARERGRKAFYTTPLKALSNQKFAELAAVYGSQSTGLLTGDVSHRPDAPVVVMTTEVLRNMFFARSPLLDGLGLVVLDEVHFLQDPFRGSVWEEVIVLAPREVVMVCLSATVSNAEQLGEWLRSVRGPTDVVVETHRPVELDHHVATGDRSTRQVSLVPVLSGRRPHPQGVALDERVAKMTRRSYGMRHSPIVSPRRTEVVEELDRRAMLPAIVFIFSRAACDDAVSQCLSDGVRFTTPDQRDEIRRRCEDHTEGFPDEELRVLGYGTWSTALEAGIASHHAGLIPAFRECVEDCFSEGLLQVVFATETLALGINMPARTVVIEKLTKVRAHGRSALTSGEYAQLTGRAGRRGLDSVGHAVTVWSSRVSVVELASLATSPAPALSSSFRTTYNLSVNVVRRYPPEEAHFVLDRSFAQFLDERHHGALSRRLDRMLQLLEERGYVQIERWRLTTKGELLARIYHESDLLVTEALFGGIFDGLEAPVLAAVASACSFETRAGRNRARPNPPGPARAPLAALDALWGDLHGAESDARLPRTRAPDEGFAEAAWLWARGTRLERVLERTELSPGDFVRNCKQLIDLLSQLAVVAPDPVSAAVAARATRALQRGVVATTLWPAPAGAVSEEELIGAVLDAGGHPGALSAPPSEAVPEAVPGAPSGAVPGAPSGAVPGAPRGGAPAGPFDAADPGPRAGGAGREGSATGAGPRP